MEFAPNTNSEGKNFGGYPKKNKALDACMRIPNCTMVVNYKCKGNAYILYGGTPVEAKDGSCSWVKGMTKSQHIRYTVFVLKYL